MEIHRARPEDSPFIREIANDAYRPYVKRIGREPAPMIADFAALIIAGEVWVAVDFAEILGYIVMRPNAKTLHIENVAVSPPRHGEGVGKALLEFAEAEAVRVGIPRLDLYTNAKMRENLALYPRLGWIETARRTEGGFERVYFEKIVSPPRPNLIEPQLP